MEKILTQEERIRRAEEIYLQRRGENIRFNSQARKKETEKKSSTLLKKMILQIMICFFLYLILSFIKNTQSPLSEGTFKQIDNFLNYEINWNQTFKVLQTGVINFNEKINSIGTKKEEDKKNEEVNEIGTKQEEIVEEINEAIEENVNQENFNVVEEIVQEENGIGGGSEEAKDTNLSQMEIDANFIKENFLLVLPVEGVITSSFGERIPTEIISANHYGTDIGAPKGTEIKSIMDGTVTLVSSIGDYGKHIKIENGEISVLYAHCSELNVEEGQEIKMGDLIAKVGSTGKATGPHLHIEIKRQDRYIDPETVLPF